MASARACSKCKDAAGVFNCAGCQKLFCSKHSIEHRQELCARFEHLMTEHNITLQQIQDRKPWKELLKKNFDARIDEWKETMMAKVCQRAEEIRRELDERMDRQNEAMVKDIRLLAEEIHRRHEKEDFFEQDIERIEQNIKEAQQTIEKSNQQSDIELCIGPDETVDWEKLIYIQERSDSASSSVTRKETNGTTNARHSDREHDLYKSIPPYYISLTQHYAPSTPITPGIPRGPNLQYISPIRPHSEQYIPPYLTRVSSAYGSPLSPPSNQNFPPPQINPKEKRQRKALAIVDPVTHRTIVETPNNTNRNPSPVAPMNPTSNTPPFYLPSTIMRSQAQTDSQDQITEQASDDSDT